MTRKEQQVLQKELDQGRSRRRYVAKLAVLSALAFVLFIAQFPLPFFPPFLTFDFSELIALLAAFSLGPVGGILVQLLKNLLHLPLTSTAMTGEFANFMVGATFVGVAGLVYKRKKSKEGAFLGMLAGTLAMAGMGALINYHVNIPFFIRFYSISLEKIVAMTQAAGNVLVVDLWSLILYAFVPFNLLKGLVISVLVWIMYKKLSPILHS